MKAKLHFWYDQWHPTGPLYQKFSENLFHAFCLTMEDTVEKCIQDGEWKWPQGRRCTEEVRRLKAITPSSFRPNSYAADVLRWEGGKNGMYTAKAGCT